jgi:hypothetical protein
LSSKDIKDEDKLKLIKATTSYSVTKGTIQKGLELMNENRSLATVVEDIRPIFMMRNVQLEDDQAI